MKKIALSAAIAFIPFSTLFAKTSYIVKLKDNAPESMAALLTNDQTTAKDIPVKFGRFIKLETDAPLAEMIQLPENVTGIEYIEPSQTYYPIDFQQSGTIDILDDQYEKQWGLKNTGTNSGGWWSRGKAGEDINAEKLGPSQKVIVPLRLQSSILESITTILT